jgi:hypothetical protein
MSEPDPTEQETVSETPTRRRARLAEVFGDVLPDTTSDEREPGELREDDAWWRSQVPPHHGS